MLQSQFKNVQFSFLLFSIYVLSILLKMSVLSFFLFSYAVFNNVQVSFLSFFLFFPSSLSCSFFFLFVFFFHFFLFFFHNKLLIQCPFFLTSYLPLCLYLNTITIGSLPSLFNFSLQYHKLSLIYNTTFSIAYEHSSSFFYFFIFLFTKYPGFFSKQPKLL